jgi:hypothetical protein
MKVVYYFFSRWVYAMLRFFVHICSPCCLCHSSILNVGLFDITRHGLLTHWNPKFLLWCEVCARPSVPKSPAHTQIPHVCEIVGWSLWAWPPNHNTNTAACQFVEGMQNHLVVGPIPSYCIYKQSYRLFVVTFGGTVRKWCTSIPHHPQIPHSIGLNTILVILGLKYPS